MSRHRQWMFLLAVACLTTVDVPAASAKENSDTKTQQPSREEVSRTGPPPLQRESSSQAKPLARDELMTQNPPPATRCESTATTRCEPTTTRCPPTTTCCGSNGDEDSSASASACISAMAERIRKEAMRLTNELSKAVAAHHIAQERERKLDVLEREKYSYVKAAAEKVLGVVDNVQHFENVLVANTYREQQAQQQLARDHRTQSRSRRKLQVIRRLIAGAEVGLVHIESSNALNRCSADSRKRQGAASSRQVDRSPSRNGGPTPVQDV